MEAVVDSREVLKPRTDNREYRCVGLENALQALIVSDPDTDKVARLENWTRPQPFLPQTPTVTCFSILSHPL